MSPLRSTLSSLTMAAPVDVYAARARYTITKYLAENSHHEILNSLPPLEKMLPVVPRVTKRLPVCTIGAGTTGLYTAMILASLGIPYVSLEASDRVGGRPFMYKGFENAEKYDCYVSVTRRMPPWVHIAYKIGLQEVGAMRFSNTPLMKRTFD